jgi:O-antigen ligase
VAKHTLEATLLPCKIRAIDLSSTAQPQSLRPSLFGILRDVYIIDKPRVPHNIYLNVLAELGAVGLVLFLTILTFSLGCALRAAPVFAREHDNALELLARGLFVALLGLLSACFVSSGHYYKELWLLLALGPALLALAERNVER